VRAAVGSESDTAATADNIGSLHAKVRKLQETVTKLQQLIGSPEICLCQEPPATLFGAIRKNEVTLIQTMRPTTTRTLDAIEFLTAQMVPGWESEGSEAAEKSLCPVCQQRTAHLVENMTSVVKLPQRCIDWFTEYASRACDASCLTEACPLGAAHLDYWASTPGYDQYSAYFLQVRALYGEPEKDIHILARVWVGEDTENRVLVKVTAAQSSVDPSSNALGLSLLATSAILGFMQASTEFTIVATKLTPQTYPSGDGPLAEGYWGLGTDRHSMDAQYEMTIASEAKLKTLINGEETAYVSYTRPPIAGPL
jgi:hypothetical protein